ncbi:MAG: HEAT repeat domain-containing protein [Spirochaetes bacterium]|nr:HEAT repeat domain-containing protein [Spirochaetota bacterium]
MKKTMFAAVIFILAAGVLYAQEEAKSAVEKKAKSTQEYIQDLSSDRDEATIIEAATYCGKEKEKDAIPGLVTLLSDRRFAVRMEAASALGLIGDESAVDALNKSVTGDESAEVRYAAVLATFRIGSKKSLDTWKQALQNETDPFIKDFLTKAEKKARE